MLRARLERRVGRVRDLGAAALHGYRHAFNKRGADGTGKGNIVIEAAQIVHGVLYQLTPGQLTSLTVYEGGYRQLALRVRPATGTPAVSLLTAQTVDVEAIGFEAIAPAGTMLPAAFYLSYYAQGMCEHRLPDTYRDAVLGQARNVRESSD